MCNEIVQEQIFLPAKGYDWIIEDNEIKILFVGNSYSEDATSCAQGSIDSPLLSIIQSMVGENIKVTIGVIISGGKGMNWHATKAQNDTSAYYFKTINSETKVWSSSKSMTMKNAFTYTNWDMISLQPYSVNTSTGIESNAYPNETDSKFLHIKDSSAYLLDYVHQYAPQAEVYLYMHWAQTSAIQMNAALSKYNSMANFFPSILEYQGEKTGKRFTTLIPVGLSIQNARTTYLSLLAYNTTAYADKNLNYTTDAQIGLQRDGGHVSFNIGRYIASLTFAEQIIPESLRVLEYILPDIRYTESIGQLPKEYTEIAQLSVFAAIESWKNGDLGVTNIDGYDIDPIKLAKTHLEQLTLYLDNCTEEEFVKKLNYLIINELSSEYVIDRIEINHADGLVTFKLRFGYMSETITLSYDVNKNGHNLIIDEKVDPTCTTTGLTEGSHCSRCNYEIAQEVIPALGHEYSDWVIVINPSCNSEGKDEKACIKCGNIIERDTRITGIENKVLVSNPVDQEYFVGKTLLTIGDSITCGVGLNDKTNEYYGKLVADALGMNVVNKGISGSVYCYGGSSTTNNTLNASNIKNADVITIFLGINDFNHACKNGHAYGNPNYTSSDRTYYQVGEYGTTDTSTLYGALKVWCENIEQLKSIEGYEDKQFVIITPLISSWNSSIGPRSWDQGKTNIHGHTLREYCTAIMRVYAEYGIPVFDANMLSGIYYNSASDNNAVATGGDGVHINAEGHKIFANSLIEFLLEGYSYEYRENNSNAHQYNKTIVDPTCTLDGYTKHICSICYDVYNTDFVNALGHEIIIDEKVEPTCENTGLTKGEHCTKCDYKVAQEVIPALGHDIVIDEKVEPEYNNPGLTEGKHCSRCYLVIEEQVIIEPNIQQMNINYDDHIDISNNVVAIIEKGNPISYKVGYGVSGELDDQVISIKNNYLVATGIGDAVVKIDDIYYEINVKSSPISLILLIGQSNMRGSEGDPNQSIICPNGMVYSTYGDDRGDKEGILNVNSARKFVPSALSGEYSMINVEGTTEHLGYYPVNSLTREGKGKFGPDSGFAYEWVKQTNEKIWVVNAAHGGSSINTWQLNATNYKEAVLMFKACQETLQKEIEAGHFTLSHMGYFWCQGCNDATQTAEWYVNKYVAMHNNLKVDLAFDHDNNENTDDVVFEFGGIIPILYGVNSYRLGVSKYKNNYTYYQSYEQLYFNGPRVAQYWLGNSQEYSDIWVVCDVQEDWVYYPDGTHGVVEYFNAHYPGGIVDYETQVKQKSSWYKPTIPADVHDSIHYNQIGYNEIGRESVRNALIMLGEIEAPDVETKVEFYSWDGITTVDEIVSLTNVCSETLIVPRIYPLWKAKDVEFILSEGLEYNYYDLTTESFDINGTLCVNIDPDTKVNVIVKELVNYEFEFVDGAYVSSNEEYNSISKIAGTFEDNVFIDARFKLAKPITLMYNQEWMLEFKLSGNWYDETSTTSKKLLCQDGASATVNSMALLITGITNRIHIGYYNGSTHVSFGVSLIDYGIDVKEEHVYQLINVINNETNMIYLVVDGQTIAPMTTCITGKNGITGEVSNYLSGKNLSFSYMGTSKYEIDNGLIHYLKVYEKDARF